MAVLWLDDIRADDLESVGGKGASLGELTGAGLPVPPGFVVTVSQGFAIGRSVAGEAELITLAVDPAAQGHGKGRKLLAAFESAAQADRLFLEVAADNRPALALYHAAGWAEAGRRPRYYPRATGGAVDALTLTKTL